MGASSPDKIRYDSDLAGTPLCEALGYDRGWSISPHLSIRSLKSKSHRRCVILLLDAGADPTIVVRRTGLRQFRPLRIGMDPTPIQSPLHAMLHSSADPHHSLHWPSAIESDNEKIFGRMIRGNFLDLDAIKSSTAEPSIWLSAFHEDLSLSIKTVRYLLEAGCDINETTRNSWDAPDGWNCLFLYVLHAEHPDFSLEFETLRLLIRQHANILAKDAFGLTVFDHVNACQFGRFAAYRRDLWYCALWREGIDTGQASEPYLRTARYGKFYTPEHYRALCYLDTWTRGDLSEQLRDDLKTHPWTEEEAAEFYRIRDKCIRQRKRWEKRERIY